MTVERPLVHRRTGAERIGPLPDSAAATLREFWEWACSDVLNNTLRGLLAEWLVGQALGVVEGRFRTEQLKGVIRKLESFGRRVVGVAKSSLLTKDEITTLSDAKVASSVDSGAGDGLQLRPLALKRAHPPTPRLEVDFEDTKESGLFLGRVLHGLANLSGHSLRRNPHWREPSPCATPLP